MPLLFYDEGGTNVEFRSIVISRRAVVTVKPAVTSKSDIGQRITNTDDPTSLA